ncbi:MAG: hypothetical protein ACRC35_04840 [Angustibacter sp.]
MAARVVRSGASAGLTGLAGDGLRQLVSRTAEQVRQLSHGLGQVADGCHEAGRRECLNVPRCVR